MVQDLLDVLAAAPRRNNYLSIGSHVTFLGQSCTPPG